MLFLDSLYAELAAITNTFQDMKNFAILILILSVAFVGCKTQSGISTTNSKETMKNKEAIEAFYGKALTVNDQTRPTEALSPYLAEGYKSSSSVDSKGAEQLLGQLEFFWKLIPDLKWEPQEVTNEGNTYVVRSIATGTPQGDFMGVLTDGTKSFKIMTIDIHKMKDGKFLSSHHVEDWATALRQLTPSAGAGATAKEVDKTMKVALGFMDAMTKGEMEKMMSFMHEDMVWHNEGDKSLPWIGIWKGKQVILEKFLPTFGTNFQTMKWESEDALSGGDTAAFFGQMAGVLTKSNQKTEPFTWALRVKIKDGKVILWNWFEDSFAVSQAYHNKK